MHDIICPHCSKAFKIDEAGYADILKQVHNREFEQQLRERSVGRESSSAEPVHIHAVHLGNDEVVDAMVSERASRQLAKAGFTVTDHHVDGPHAWSPALTDLVTQLLTATVFP